MVAADPPTSTPAAGRVSFAGQAASTARRGPDRSTVDREELAAEGGYPLRIQPAAALARGRGDACPLSALWYVRTSFYWLTFGGFAIGTSVTIWRGSDTVDVDGIAVDWTSPASVSDGLLSEWSLLIVALIVRFVTMWVALALRLPLAGAHAGASRHGRTSGGRSGSFFDRLDVARAFRSLWWTHDLRRIALRRLGRADTRAGRLDPVLDVVNIAAGVAAVAAPLVTAAHAG